jgi:single-strand DNA-binding protein
MKMNQVIISGRMVRDAEIRYNGADQLAVGRFSVACDRPPKNGERQADFISCVAFGKTAENMERFTGKGLRVAVVGRITTGQYTNKDGQKVYTTDVVADWVEFIDWKGKDGQNAKQGGSDDIPEGFSAVDDNELPF